jgi:signal transduction histidine kinase
MNLAIDNLKDSISFLTLILESINSAVFIVDKNLKITNVNNVFFSIFNVDSKKDVIGELFGNAIDCLNLEDNKFKCGETPYCNDCDIRNAINKAIRKKEEINRKTIEKEIKVDKDIIKKYFQFTIKHLNYSGNEMAIIIIDDITELENQKLKLEYINQEKNKILGIAAHDLRNPISIIQIYSEFILDRMSSNLSDEQLKFINQIYKTSFVMLNLLQDILDISKIESGTIVLKKSKVDYLEFLKKCIEPNNIIAHKKNIDIQLKENKVEKLIITIDENRMIQVLNNLLSNAIKFSKMDTKITVSVSVSSKNNKVLTEIIDNGLGIAESDMDKIFKPFHKGSFKPTGDEPQTGLGLAIVKKIIEAHNGTIDFKSEAGKGSNFYFYLPLK